MAKRTSTLVGLEIEPSGVHAAAVGPAGALQVEHAAFAPLEAGVVRDGEVTDVEALASVLRDLFREHGGLDKRVRIGIANQKIVVRVLELPVIEDRAELEAAVRFTAQDQIPMPLDAASVDFQVLDVVQTDTGPRQRVLLVAARRDMVAKVLDAVRGAGLRPEGVDLSAFGMVRALHAHGAGPGAATLYLAIGGLTNLAVAQGTSCTFTRVVGGGLEGLAIELAERRAMSLDAARGWLHRIGLAAPLSEVDGFDRDPQAAADAREVLLDGVRRIAGEVRNTTDFHRSTEAAGSAQPLERCVLTGAAAAVPGFAEALQEELGLPVVAVGAEGELAGLPAGDLAIAAGLAVEEARA